jgi:hypothetical protein
MNNERPNVICNDVIAAPLLSPDLELHMERAMHPRTSISLNADGRALLAKWRRGVFVFYLVVVASIVVLPTLQANMNTKPAEAVEASATFGNPLP